MPVVAPGSKILVSGANDFIAPSLNKGALRTWDNFELVVEDTTKEGAFDDAVKGIDAIQHAASPFHYNVDDPKELIEPDVNGAVGMLKSAMKNA
ncbi:hypothetical protein F5887DRAFT_1076218 [Amanita rubescens]|nr:hypothetical protein F5887DRAFT_1076218 [Amanita rubescens]